MPASSIGSAAGSGTGVISVTAKFVVMLKFEVVRAALGEEDVERVLGAGRQTERLQTVAVDRLRHGRVDAAEVDPELAAEVDPQVVVTGEIERLTVLEREAPAELQREIEVTRVALVAAELVVDREKGAVGVGVGARVRGAVLQIEREGLRDADVGIAVPLIEVGGVREADPARIDEDRLAVGAERLRDLAPLGTLGEGRVHVGVRLGEVADRARERDRRGFGLTGQREDRDGRGGEVLREHKLTFQIERPRNRCRQIGLKRRLTILSQQA